MVAINTNTTLATLSNDQLHRSAPSIFAPTPWHRMSERYRFVPTIEVVDCSATGGSCPFAPSRAAAASRANGPSQNISAHEANSVCGPIPIITPRNSSVTSLMLWPHSNIATYCDAHHLLTPRNGRRKFRSPVQVPSIVLQCTSRTPSPSASIA